MPSSSGEIEKILLVMRDLSKNPRVCVSSIGGKLNSHLVNGGAIYQAVLSSFLGKMGKSELFFLKG